VQRIFFSLKNGAFRPIDWIARRRLRAGSFVAALLIGGKSSYPQRSVASILNVAESCIEAAMMQCNLPAAQCVAANRNRRPEGRT